MVTYTKEEKQAIMEDYKSSGKSLREYAEENLKINEDIER